MFMCKKGNHATYTIHKCCNRCSRHCKHYQKMLDDIAKETIAERSKNA